MAPQSFPKRIPLPPPPEGSKRVFIVFNVTRARIDKGHLPPDLVGYQWMDAGQALDRIPSPSQVDPLPNVLALRIRGVGPGEQRTRSLDITANNEQPETVKIVFDLGQRCVVFENRLSPCWDALELWQRNSTFPASKEVFGPADYIDYLRADIDVSEPAKVRHHRRFFFGLDCQTEDKLAAVFLVLQQYRDLTQWLADVSPAAGNRLKARLREYLDDPLSYTPYANLLNVKDSVKEISLIFWRLLVKHFPPAQPQEDPTPAEPDENPERWFDLQDLEVAFQAFADGALRMGVRVPHEEPPVGVPDERSIVWTTQPSSGFFFLFAEFALLAAECAVYKSLWIRLANVMIRSQVHFATRYRPHSAPAAGAQGYKTTDYRGCDYRQDAELTQEDQDKRNQILLDAGTWNDLPSLAIAAAKNTKEYLLGER